MESLFMRISVFTPSFNKPQYVMDAINSVLNQSHQDWEYWILENSTDGKTRDIIKKNINLDDKRIKYVEKDFTKEERAKYYPTTYLLNRYYRKATGDLIAYLSDDDILYPGLFSKISKFFKENKDKQIGYFSLKSTIEKDGVFVQENQILAEIERGLGTEIGVSCSIDGGQMAHRKSCLDKISWPYYLEEITDASIVDGIFMNKLAEKFTFYPMGDGSEFFMEHRRTKISVWNPA